MEDLVFSIWRTQIGTEQVVGRMVMAALLGLLIGLNREYHPSPAGMRTHMLVALGAATFAILTEEIVLTLGGREGVSSEPVRIIEAVTAGVAFLAAGTIIQSRGRVHGLTTGAGMWLSGAIGLACGIGVFFVGIVATALCLIILTLIKWIERRLPKKKGKHLGEEFPAEAE